ncbi:MAG: hypothetical protein OXN94_04875, partial [Chloroflexota bacterium]|nr:hypothetical protein [Chloroflexota bacterium]
MAVDFMERIVSYLPGCISIFWQMSTGQSLQKWYLVEQCNEQTKNSPQSHRSKTKKEMQILLKQRSVRLVRYWVMLTRF